MARNFSQDEVQQGAWGKRSNLRWRNATQLQQSIAENSEARFGGVAQLGEHLPCKQGVRSSILLVSTIMGL